MLTNHVSIGGRELLAHSLSCVIDKNVVGSWAVKWTRQCYCISDAMSLKGHSDTLWQQWLLQLHLLWQNFPLCGIFNLLQNLHHAYGEQRIKYTRPLQLVQGWGPSSPCLPAQRIHWQPAQQPARGNVSLMCWQQNMLKCTNSWSFTHLPFSGFPMVW